MSRLRASRLRVVAVLTALLVVDGAAAVAAGAGGGAGAAATRVAAAAGDGLQGYQACLAAQRTGDMLILIDESGSLRETDPEDARVTAASYLVDRLADSAAEAEIQIDVAVAGFSSDYGQALSWTSLDAAGRETASEAVQTFATRDRGLDTDYWTALEGARQALADRAVAMGATTRCQAIAWFSDGALDIEPRDSLTRRRTYGTEKPYAPGVDLRTPEAADAAEQAARDSLCQPAGLADQLRASHVWIFGVGLAAGTGSPPDFSLMRSISTGEGEGGTTCGAIQEPTPGEFALASNIDDLLFEWNITPITPRRGEVGICQGQVCLDQAHHFVLDASISSVHVLGSSAIPGVRAVLIAPDLTELELANPGVGVATEAVLAGASIDYTWYSERTVAVDLHSQSEGWAGRWSFLFVDDSSSSPEAKSRSSIYITGNLLPAWIAPTEDPVRAGESAPGRLGLVTTAGEAVDPASLLGEAEVSADLLAPDGTTTPIASEISGPQWAEPRALDLTEADPGEYFVRMRLSVTTAAATLPDGSVVPGTELAVQRVDAPITVLAPADFPTVAGPLNFGQAEGPADLTAVLSVSGPGCVWIDPGATQLRAFPAEAGDVVVGPEGASSPEECLEVPEGEEAELPVSLVSDDAGNGSINGFVTVSSAPVGELSRTVEQQIPFTADLRKPLNTTTFVAGLILALVLGPGIPLAILYAIKWYAANIPPRPLAARLVPVVVAQGAVLRDGQTFALREEDMRHMVPLSMKGARRVDVDGGLTLRTSVGWSPFGEPHVIVESPGLVGASSTNPRPVGKDRRAQLPVAVHNTWAVLADPGASDGAAYVLCLVGVETSEERRRSYVDDINARVPSLYPDLLSSAQGERPPDEGPVAAGARRPSSPSGSSASSPPAPAGGGGAGPPIRPDDPFNFSAP